MILVKLLEARAEKAILLSSDNKDSKIPAKAVDYEKVANELIAGKKLDELGIKPFFRLHPPRKGIKSKLQYPKGVLGNHQDKIQELLGRML
jgi:hypothetical protein